MPGAGRGGEFRVELAGHKPGMARQLNDLHQFAVQRTPGDGHACGLQPGRVMIVELVTMPVPLNNRFSAIQLARERACREPACLPAEAHAAAQIRIRRAPLTPARGVLPLADQGDHGIDRVRVEFRAIGRREAGQMTRDLDHRQLHAETNAKIRRLFFARITHGHELALDTAPAKAARHQHGGRVT